MNRNGEDRIRRLLEEGWQLLRAGRGREAGDAFGRILLQDPAHVEARRGLDEARVVAAEQARLLDARVDEARRAEQAGDRDEARRLLEQVVALGGDRDRALVLLDRLEDRGGRLETPAAALESLEDTAPAASLVPRAGWSRRAFAMGWTFVLVGLLAAAALSWDRVVDRLVRTPEPESRLGAPASDVAASDAPGSVSRQ